MSVTGYTVVEYGTRLMEVVVVRYSGIVSTVEKVKISDKACRKYICV